MPVESLAHVNVRIGLQLARIESRTARRRPVDMAGRMAAIRRLADAQAAR